MDIKAQLINFWRPVQGWLVALLVIACGVGLRVDIFWDS